MSTNNQVRGLEGLETFVAGVTRRPRRLNQNDDEAVVALASPYYYDHTDVLCFAARSRR
jgi:hypothetical protein